MPAFNEALPATRLEKNGMVDVERFRKNAGYEPNVLVG